MEALGDRHTVTAVPGVRLPGGMLSAQTWFICQAFSVSYSKIHSIIVTHLKSYCSYFNCAQSLQSCPALCDPLDCSPPGSCSWDFPGKNTGVGCHFLLQEIFLTQGSDSHLLHLLHWQVDSLPLSYLGSPDFSPITSKSATFHWDSSLDSEVRK